MLFVMSFIGIAAPTCCRWTSSGACGSAETDECTEMFEYLEHKTTTHVFEDIDGCLGPDRAQWHWQFDGTTSNATVTGSNGSRPVPTPLKVTHAANCSSEAPTLSLQLDTVVTGKMIVGGYDVGAILSSMVLSPPPSPPASPPASASSCCRWTPTGACASQSHACTDLHEYLEHKTTTHEFVEVAGSSCLGSDETKWSWQFDGSTGNVTLSSAGSVVTKMPTPLLVSHSADCSATNLTLQMDTVATGRLIVGGIDVFSALESLGAAGLAPADRRLAQPEEPSPAPPGLTTAVSALGEATQAGRRLSSDDSLCLRWTPSGESASFHCTQLHEYLERKTTTHVFDDVEACLGNDHTRWGWLYDGSSGNTTLTGDKGPHHILSPLEVTHSRASEGCRPTLTLPHDTVIIAGSLTVGGYDVAATIAQLREPSPPPSPPPPSPPPSQPPSPSPPWGFTFTSKADLQTAVNEFIDNQYSAENWPLTARKGSAHMSHVLL